MAPGTTNAFLLSFASGRLVDSPKAGPPSGQAWPADDGHDCQTGHGIPFLEIGERTTADVLPMRAYADENAGNASVV